MFVSRYPTISSQPPAWRGLVRPMRLNPVAFESIVCLEITSLLYIYFLCTSRPDLQHSEAYVKLLNNLNVGADVF